jgi:hypothetical protein
MILNVDDDVRLPPGKMSSITLPKLLRRRSRRIKIGHFERLERGAAPPEFCLLYLASNGPSAARHWVIRDGAVRLDPERPRTGRWTRQISAYRIIGYVELSQGKGDA